MRIRILCGLVVLAAVGFSDSIVCAQATAIDRGELVLPSAIVGRRPVGGGPAFAQTSLYSDFQSASGLVPAVVDLSASSSGTVFDTATGTQLVATGQGSVSLHSVVTSDGPFFAGYDVTGHYGGSLTTGVLSGYTSPDAPDPSEAFVNATPVYNSGLGFIVSSPIDYEMSSAQTDTFGIVINTAFLYLDFNNDNSFVEADGDVAIDNITVFGDDSQTHFGTLAPSLSPYRLSYFGNVFDDTTLDNTSLDSFANFSTHFAVIPEPGSLGLIGVALLGAMKRRR